MSDAALQTLRAAIDRNLAVDVSMPADGPGEPRRGRLLAEVDGTLVVEPPTGQSRVIDSLRRSDEPVGVAFRRGEHDVCFEAMVLRQDPAFRLSPAVVVEAMVLTWPAGVKLTQRRNGYRVKLPYDAAVFARAWYLPAGAGTDGVPPGLEWTVAVRDLSVCGMGLILTPASARLPGTRPGDRLRVELVSGDRRIVTATRVRQPPRLLPDQSVRIGLDFDGMDQTIAGRRTLAQVEQLVAALQRTEARRSRVGRGCSKDEG